MSSSIMLKTVGAAMLGSLVETKYAPKHFPRSTSVTSNTVLGLSPWFGLTPLILLGTSFWTLGFGMQVGAARRKYTKLAEDEGEENVSERYALPNLYAQGTSKNARGMNCVQRAHQHIYENLSIATFASLAAAVNYPITAALSTLIYAAGRVAFSNGYANSEGNPDQRYSSVLARYMWYGLLTNVFLGMLSSIRFVSNKKLFW